MITVIQKHLYMAGPLFTTGERNFNAELAERLRFKGYVVFLPQENEQKVITAQKIFAADVAGIDWADIIVACMDGPDPDSGTCWEVGSVFRRKPVVLYRTDIRSESPPLGPYNLMMHQAATRVLDCQWLSVDEIANRLDIALDEIEISYAGAG
jgi:nucleoside 2-deoxyribosyltransferase